MKVILPAILFCLLSVVLPAQRSAYTYVFQITADEAEKLYQQKEQEFYCEPYLYQLVDSTYSWTPSTMPSGHYLLVRAEKEALDIRQHSVHEHAVQQLLKNDDQLRVAVLDTNGYSLNNANIYFDGEAMRWQENAQSYSIRRARNDGWLRVELPGDTLFYQVNHRKIKPQRRNFFRTPLGYILSSPYRWAKHTYFFFQRGLGRGNWYFQQRPFWPFRKNDQQLRGYIALNQPIFRPGDTLKVKTYLTKKNGRPWKKDIRMELYGGRSSEKIVTRDLHPDRPGAFASEIVLADSLQLDQYYNLRFWVPGENKYGGKTQRFKLEDYELDAATFSLDMTKKEYFSDEPVYVTAKGEDENGNPLPGARVELLVLRQNVVDMATDSLLIPDTLWIHQHDLSLREENKIRLPDSIFPPATLDLKVEAFFAAASGESEQKTVNFRYNYQSGQLDYSLQDGEWDLRFLESDSSISQTVYLQTFRTIPPFRSNDTISLPTQLPLDPFVTAYSVEDSKQFDHTITIENEDHGMRLFGDHLGDSLLIDIINPNGVSIHYQIFAGGQQMTEGEVTESRLLAFPANPRQKYELYYQYSWAGYPKNKQLSFQNYERQLRLTTEIPRQIFPGQTVQVKIKAVDSKRRPASGVEMIAGATNGQFNSNAHLSPPLVTYKNRKGHQQRHRFTLAVAANNHRSAISPDWYQRMGLSDNLYYKIRYPEQGVFVQRDTILKDSFYLNHPQISPYLVENHQLQPIYLIYLNRELVYSHYSEDDKPYAFNARPGYNQLRLRTRKAEYRIDSVYIQRGQQLSFAIDEQYYGQHPVYGSRIKRTSADTVLSRAEKALLNARMIQIRKEEKRTISYLFSDSTKIYRWNTAHAHNSPRIIGPVPPNKQLTYIQRDGLRNTFLHEPTYIYEIREGRERLYAHPFLKDKNQYYLPPYLPHPQLGQRAFTPDSIIAISPKQKKINFRRSWSLAPRGGGLQIFTNQPLAAIVLQNANGNYSVYRSNRRKLEALPKGLYELTLINHIGQINRRTCWIYPNQLQVLNLRNANFEQDTSLSVIEDLYTYNLVKPSFINRQGEHYANRYSNPYQGVGYLATGRIVDGFESDEPLIGASILLVGTSIGTVTDIDGNWSLWVPDEDAELLISYTGFESHQIAAGKADDRIVMEAGEMLLDEIVVTAYRVPLIEQDNTTQGATLTSDQIRRLPTRNINALASSTAGISVTDGSDLNIRGSRSVATNYYVDGVRVSGVVPGAELLLSGSGIRREFRDYGFWETDLITDKEGEAYFTVTFPDDITQWETFVLGMDDRKRAGAWYGQTAAFKPVLAQLYLPRFLLPGDQVDLVGSSVNYTNDTLQVNTQFEVEGEVLLKEVHQLTDGITDQINYTVGTDLDSLKAKYTLQTGNYEDGEERSIPIFKVGTEETLGSFHRLEGDTSMELSFQAEDGSLTIYAEPDMLRVMLKEIDALRDYPYGCNEQSASRLLALLMHRQVQEALAKPYDDEKAIQEMVALLRQRQLPDGSWGWWGGSARNHWMTIYVLRALYAAKEAGFATEAYEKGMIFLTNQLSNMKGKDRLEAIALFSEVGQNMDYTTLLMPYDTLPGLNWTTLTTMLIKAEQGLPVPFDTLIKYRNTTLFGGHFWGKDGYGFYNNQIQYSLLAYRIYQANGQSTALEPIRQFFLERRHQGPGYYRYAGYRNTFEAAMILKTILPDLLLDYKDQSELAFEQELQIITADTIRWEKLPQQLEIDTGTPLLIRKTGVGRTYLTAYQQRWNPQPERVEGPFVVTTSLWQANQQTQQLEQSKPARIKVNLTVEKAASYVLLEVPIPAGCSYGAKPQSRWSYQETYREYFRDKVAIFCERLTPGDYTYYVELEPRFTGEFQLNPAKAEQMYFPVFYGREGMKEVRIE